jgi:hypothetical protein
MRRAMRTAWKWVVVALVACVVLAGCGSGGEDAEPEATAAPTQPPVTATLAGVGEIVWTAAVDQTTNAPTEQLTALRNDAPQVIAALPVETLPAGTVLRAHWTIDGDPLPELDPAPVMVDEGRAGAWVTWTLRWEGSQPWPVGQLGIIVVIDGGDELRAEIPIVRPNG